MCLLFGVPEHFTCSRKTSDEDIKPEQFYDPIELFHITNYSQTEYILDEVFHMKTTGLHLNCRQKKYSRTAVTYFNLCGVIMDQNAELLLLTPNRNIR